MEKNNDMERDKLLLYSLKDVVTNDMENITNKTQMIDENSTNLQYPTAKAVFNLMEENMIDTTNLESNLNNLDSNMNTNLHDLVVAIRGIGADFSQVEATASDVKSGKKFFDDEGVLQTGTIPTYSDSTTITQNGNVSTTGKYFDSDLTVAVPRPQLNAPTLALSGDTLTITNTNGNFIVNFEIYADNTLLCTTANASIDLSDYLENAGTYSITAICTGTNFEDSLASASINYIITPSNILTSITQISELNILPDESIFNTSTHEKLPFTSKGTNGPTAVIFFRQAYDVTLTPTITLQFFLRSIPANTSTLPCIIKLNDTIISNTALTIVSGQDYDATITLSNLTSSSFNKLEIEFNDATLSTMQLDYVDIEITNTQNCIILNRDDSFCACERFDNSYNKCNVSSAIRNGEYKYNCATNPTIATILNPGTSYYHSQDNEGNSFNVQKALPSFCQHNGYVAISFYAEWFIGAFISNNTNNLWIEYRHTNYFAKAKENVFQTGVSAHNGEVNFSSTVVAYITGTTYQGEAFLFHAISPHLNSYSYTLNSQLLPLEFYNVCCVNDIYMRNRTVNVQNVGYFALHKSGNILFFPQVNNTYCLKIGKGRQFNAYLSEDGLRIDIYYNLNDQVIKKSITRSAINAEWVLENSSTITIDNCKDYRLCLNNKCYKFYNNTWQYV